MVPIQPPSIVVRIGDIAYYARDYPEQCEPIDSGQFLEPCTVISVPDSIDYAQRIPASFLQNIVDHFAETDDVWSKDFLHTVILRSNRTGASLYHDANVLLKEWKVKKIYHQTIVLGEPEGPFFLTMGRLHAAYRLYPDTANAFIMATVESDEVYSYQSLNAIAYGETYPSSLAIAVPSRLYHKKSVDKPFAGTRIGIKDTINLKGLRTGGASRAYTQLYEPRKQSAAVIQHLLEMGFIVVGKTRTTQFADSEWPTCDYVDYHGPFNPRADGYQTPSGSSSGSAVAVAAYSWLDATIGSDTLGSIRNPAAAQGIFGLRPSTNTASLEGVIPFSPHFDTIGCFARDTVSLNNVSEALYGWNHDLKCTNAPSAILYPEDYWPSPDSQSQVLFDQFISRLEKFLGVKRTIINLESLWNETSPSGTSGTLQEHCEHIFEWVANLDQWEDLLQPFITDYEAAFGHQPVLNPQFQFKQDWLPTLEAGMRTKGIEALAIYKDWFHKNVLPPAENGCCDKLLVLPWSTGQPNYRDTYRERPRFTGAGFFFYNVLTYAGCPEYVVPVGQTKFRSRLTGHDEVLPAAIGISTGSRGDSMLSALIQDLLTAEGNDSVLTGKASFDSHSVIPS